MRTVRKRLWRTVRHYRGHDGLFGVEKRRLSAYLEYQTMKQELAESEPNREAQLLYGKENRFGIYQLKSTEETKDFAI